jgi:hypothetical protein
MKGIISELCCAVVTATRLTRRAVYA